MRFFASIFLPLSFALPVLSDEVLPISYPLTRYTAIWQNSPFEREVVKPVVETISSTFGRDLALEGLIQDSKKGPVAYMRNVKDNVPLVVTKSPAPNGAHPYTIVSATQAHNPAESTVIITDGKEKAEIGFVETMLTQAIAAPVRQQPRNENDPRRNAEKAAQRNPTPPRPKPPANASTSAQNNTRPQAETPALDDIDEPRRRRILLPGASRND